MYLLIGVATALTHYALQQVQRRERAVALDRPLARERRAVVSVLHTKRQCFLLVQRHHERQLVEPAVERGEQGSSGGPLRPAGGRLQTPI